MEVYLIAAAAGGMLLLIVLLAYKENSRVNRTIKFGKHSESEGTDR
jgi:hypothetical protein